MQQTYSTKEILIDMLNFSSTHGTSKERVINSAKNAGLIIEALPTRPGQASKFVIIKNELNLPNEIWVPCYYTDAWEVSNMGRIRKISTKKLMGHVDGQNEYVRVCTIDPETKKSINL